MLEATIHPWWLHPKETLGILPSPLPGEMLTANRIDLNQIVK